MRLAFDVFLDQVRTPEQRASLLQSLRGKLRKGDTVWLAIEGDSVARNPAVLDQLAAEKKAWLSVLGPAGVKVQTRIRFERIHTNLPSSVNVGLQDTYRSVLLERKREHLPIADAISYDYEAYRGFTGGEYTPHDTANAARLFAEGQRVAKSLGTRYFVEPSVSPLHGHATGLHHVTLDWQRLSRFTDGFNFQTQRIVAGTSDHPVDGPARAARRAAYGETVGALVEKLRRGPERKKPWVMAQVSTEWSQPQTVVAAAAKARDQAPDIRAYYVWWFDPGRTEALNASNLLKMISLWNETFRR